MAVKIVGAGFYNDAALLLNEFVDEESCEFKTFAAIWRKKNFSFIFMGRESKKDLIEFTNEIFYLSSDFLTYDSFLFQIGGVFLLYALYRNQILCPPIRIRMDLPKYKIMKLLLDRAIADNFHSLHYVLDYLFRNALELVAFSTLLGPLVNTFDRGFKSEPQNKMKFSEFKCNLEEFKEKQVLEDLNDNFLKYEELKPFPRSPYTDNRCKKLISILSKLIVDQPTSDNDDMNSQTALVNIPSEMHSQSDLLKSAKNVRCEYPFLDTDLNQLFCIDDSCATESDIDENEHFSITTKDVGQSLECDELYYGNVKLCKHQIRQRTIREYYEESPTKANIYLEAMSHVEVLMLTDSEDELLADGSSLNF